MSLGLPRPAYPARLLLGAALLGGCKEATPATAPLQVAAASDLSLAFEKMGALYEARTGEKVVFSFAASGALSQQLGQGAPFDLFAAANASFVDQAVRAGACDGTTRLRYGRGHVVVWTKKPGLRLRTLADLRSADVKHIALANPEHAPYGKAAEQALERAGLRPELEGKLVRAENVRQALQLAQTGNADVAFVALSLVMSIPAGVQLAVPETLHDPIEQTLVVCQNGKNRAGAERFASLVASEEGQRVLAGFGLGPGSGK